MEKKESDKRPNEPHKVVTHWLSEIAAAKKREKDFRKEGQRILDLYEGKTDSPFNILYSNTETLLPALYSAVPRPVVQRRFKDEDPLGKAAADAGLRVLEFLVDTNLEGYETFDDGLRSATLDGLLPGRGITTIKYDAQVADVAQEAGEAMPVKTSELVCLDTKSWNRVYFGYAKKWSKVPWIAYEEDIDEDEAERLFGKEITERIVFTDREKDEKDNDDYEDLGDRKVANIFQIWEKSTRKVFYISAQYIDGYLKEEDDPLQLTGFFNTPRPMTFFEKSNDMLPVALYGLYENQAKELNRITLRINKVVEAMKARGAYDAELGEDLGRIMEGDDNVLIPADKSASLAAEKGFQNAIWFMPLDVLAAVLDRLYIAREQCKQVIFEIMGMSDIVRGASKASETLGAQEIKVKFGGMRMKNKQKEVARYARDLLRMMLEIASTKFSEETFAKMTGLPFLATQQAEQLKVVMQQMQMQGAQMAAVGQQPTPQQMQQMQQLQMELQKPVWGPVLDMLRNDQQRAYRIDIETNSTVEPEAVEDQKNISDLMTALGQFLNGVGPLVAKGVMPFQAAQQMMLAISRRFRFGSEIEDEIKAMKAPSPEDDGKAAAAQADQAKMQADMQDKEKQRAFEMEKAKAEGLLTGQIEMAKHQREQQAEQNRAAEQSAKLQQERDLKLEQIRADKEAKLSELQAQRATEQMKAELMQQTELQKASLAGAVQLEIARINAAQKSEAAAGEAQKAQEQAAGSEDMMKKILETQAKLMEKIAVKPAVKVQRDGQGRALRLVPETVQ